MKPYTSNDIAFVIPTKDRPEKIRNTLGNLARQSQKCGSVIVVASGGDIGDLVRSFADRLAVEYHHLPQPGQMRQRNHGINNLPASARLVGFLDDDIVLDPEALERMILFWNSIEPETAGVAFNIIEESNHDVSTLTRIFRHFFPPGHVYKSGFSVPFGKIERSIRTKRLNGGATIWKREILFEFTRPEIDAKWAICEDLIFCYPIGKNYPLYVCADAKVLHDHIVDPLPAGAPHRLRGRTWALWQLYFVTINRDLSVAAYVLNVLGLVASGMVIGLLIPSKRFYLRFYAGLLQGAYTGLFRILRGHDLLPLLKEW